MERGDDVEILEVTPVARQSAACVVYVVHDSDSECSDVEIEIVDHDPAYSAADVAVDATCMATTATSQVCLPSTEPPPLPPIQVPEIRRELTVVTWNVDGLNNHFLHERIGAVCTLALRLAPDIVFLQEIVPDIEPEIREKFEQYVYLPGDFRGNYVATLLNKNTITYESHSVVPFTSSEMQRHIVFVETTFNGKHLVLLNTHLESMDYYNEVGKIQLRRCFRMCRKEAAGRTVIFGGDLNIRDDEVLSAGGLPSDLQDMSIASVSNLTRMYTWDMVHNSNLGLTHNQTLKFRYDRVFVWHSEPPSLAPVGFELIGKECLEQEKCFPCDHWGIVYRFKCC